MTFTPAQKRAIYKNAGGLCFYCGTFHPISETAPHHKIPQALGGTDKISNGMLLCNNCHAKVHGWKPKGNLNRPRRG